MLKNILNLEGVQILSKSQQKQTFGGGDTNEGTTCKATCNDQSLVTVLGCSSKDIACAAAGGAASCKCTYPGPLDPPG